MSQFVERRVRWVELDGFGGDGVAGDLRRAFRREAWFDLDLKRFCSWLGNFFGGHFCSISRVAGFPYGYHRIMSGLYTFPPFAHRLRSNMATNVSSKGCTAYCEGRAQYPTVAGHSLCQQQIDACRNLLLFIPLLL